MAPNLRAGGCVWKVLAHIIFTPSVGSKVLKQKYTITIENARRVRCAKKAYNSGGITGTARAELLSYHEAVIDARMHLQRSCGRFILLHHEDLDNSYRFSHVRLGPCTIVCPSSLPFQSIAATRNAFIIAKEC